MVEPVREQKAYGDNGRKPKNAASQRRFAFEAVFSVEIKAGDAAHGKHNGCGKKQRKVHVIGEVKAADESEERVYSANNCEKKQAFIPKKAEQLFDFLQKRTLPFCAWFLPGRTYVQCPTTKVAGHLLLDI